MNLLEVQGLRKTYPAFRLEDVSFSVPEGAVMGLIGRNGAGKSTSLKSILGLVHPDAGRVEMFGREFSENERYIKENIGVVLGGIDFYPKKKVRTITDVTRRFYSNWQEEKYRHYLDLFAIDENKRVDQLSSGMRVKYLLALALSHNARLLILDEPTSGLDPVSRDELLDTFLTLCEQEGVSILFSTHITSDLDACADTITYIRNGEIFASEARRAFTERYRYLRADEAAVSPELAAKLIAPRRHQGEIEGLLRTADAPEAGSPATLEQIMVHLEREVEA